MHQYIQNNVPRRHASSECQGHFVCHSSDFQMSVRSVYIKIINYSGSTFANLNNIMQTKQFATKKPRSFSIETLFTKNYVFLAESVENHSISLNCMIYLKFISTGAVFFLIRQEYLKQDSDNNLKQILFFLTINSLKKKVDVN